MKALAELRKQLPNVTEAQMRADGYCLWLVWQGELNTILEQTLADYGGVCIVGGQGQSLWFFFTQDVFLAAARLSVWARFNSPRAAMQIFPARLQVDTAQHRMLVFDEPLWQQTFPLPSTFQVWVHGAATLTLAALPGISMKETPGLPGMAGNIWGLLEADARLPYQSSFAWYAIIHPVGNPLDKAFQSGWREFFGHIENLLRRNKLRFTLHNYYLTFPLDGLRQFKSWCQEFLALVDRLKAENPNHYWPCVQAIIDKKGVNYTEDLPQRVGIDWDQLSPDYPYTAMRSALLLGDEFVFHPARFAASSHSSDDWCSITLRSEEKSSGTPLPQLLPSSMMGANPQCFYCGQRSHITTECPSRTMPAHNGKVWNEMATFSFADMMGAVKEIDVQFAKEEPPTMQELAAELTPSGTMVRAFYDIAWPTQLRAISTFWRLRGKDMAKALAEQPAPEDDSPLWPLLLSFTEREPAALDKELQGLSHRFPKDFRIASLRGFAALEQGDYVKAGQMWKEAEVYSTFPVIQAWHVFLQARVEEFQGNLLQARQMYEAAKLMTPAWSMLEQRIVVCDIKRGFSELALSPLKALVEQNGNYFNKFLIDPEIERGSIHVFSCLLGLWANMDARVEQEESRLAHLQDELVNWFMPGNAFAEATAERIQNLMAVTQYKNYVAYQSIAYGRVRIERDLQSHIRQEAKRYKDEFSRYVERLQAIREESAWFPFQRVMAEFNRQYNKSVENLNWASRNGFQTAETFKKAQILVGEEAERMKRLESRMRFLRIIRDGTLFMLSLVETFFWIELIGIIAIFVLLPLLLVYGDRIGMDMLVAAASKQRWQVQKVLFFFITIVAIAVAGLRTALRFEAIREKVFAKARKKEEIRLEKRKKDVQRGPKKQAVAPKAAAAAKK